MLSGGSRFACELIAWIAGPWAIATYSIWLVAPSLIVLIGLPAVFSTPGDKNKIVVPTPGPIRVLIELMLYAVAAVAPWFVWPTWAASASGLVVVMAVVLGLPRFLWLLRGAR